MRKKRLETVDIWKGITILSVVLIHTVFWSGRLYLPDWTRQVVLLLDVTVFFFISGYLLRSRSSKTVVQRTGRQSLRLFIDYGIVTILGLGIAIALYYLLRLGHLVEFDLQAAIHSALKFDPSDSVWEVIQVYGGSMWYLRVYMAVLVVGLIILATPIQKGFFILPLVSFGGFLLIMSYPELVAPFLFTDTLFLSFYLTVFLAGAVFKRYKHKLTMRMLWIAWSMVLAVSLVVVLQEGGLPDLQSEKFPPTPIYLLFSLHSILAFCALLLYEQKSGFDKRGEQVRDFSAWFGRHSFRVYLWQGVAASIPYFFVPAMVEKGLPPVVIFLISLTWSLGLTLGLTYVYNRMLPIKLLEAVIGIKNEDSRRRISSEPID